MRCTEDDNLSEFRINPFGGKDRPDEGNDSGEDILCTCKHTQNMEWSSLREEFKGFGREIRISWQRDGYLPRAVLRNIGSWIRLGHDSSLLFTDFCLSQISSHHGGTGYDLRVIRFVYPTMAHSNTYNAGFMQVSR